MAPAAPASPPLPPPAPPPATVAEPAPPPAVAFWPVFGWLALQTVALLAAALRIPLSAQFPAPAEQLAMHEMIVVQVVGSALLFPLLFPTVATGLLIAGSAALMLQLAAVLAGQSNRGLMIVTCVYVAGWLVGLGLWSSALRTTRAKLYGVAGAALLAVGGTIVAYVGREFGAPADAFDWGRSAHHGPVIGAMAALESGRPIGAPWVFLGAFIASGVAAASIAMFRHPPPLSTRETLG
jgi:hypothetical protein